VLRRAKAGAFAYDGGRQPLDLSIVLFLTHSSVARKQSYKCPARAGWFVVRLNKQNDQPIRCLTMDDQHPKLVIDSRVARRRLAQEFESASKTQRRVSPVRNRRLATAPQKNASEGKAPYPDPVRSIACFIHRTRSRKTQPDIPKRDISGFGFLLILMLLCEIAAAQTDNPVFWLLVGPTPLAVAFMANRFLQYRPTRSGSGKTISQE
jgi:hypothetical protein